MKHVFLLLVVTLLVTFCNGECQQGANFAGIDFSRCQKLDDNYDVYWNVQNNDLTLALHQRKFPQGWVGIGTSVNGGMRGADIAIARMVKGEYVLEDRFVPGLEGEPKVDAHQDLKLISAISSEDSLVVVFTRKIIPCDVDEDVAIQENETPIIFAYGANFGYHAQNRGTTEIYFHSIPTEKPLPADTRQVQILMPPYNVPAKDTTYTCVPIEVPHDQKYHIVKWRPIIDPANLAYVHHMVLFKCPEPESGEPYECGMAPENCQEFFLAWSVGQPGNEWMEDFALPIGGDDGFDFGELQIHYNNPGEVQGIVDTSGFELYYTPTLRKFDIGTFIMSTSMSDIFIPPNTDNITQRSECPSECTKNYPTFRIINYFPHMHQIGRQIWTQHIRDGVELPEIHRDDHYDFQRQQSYSVDTAIVPGDRLIIHCIWNSIGRAANTTGGESSSQEMCVVIFQYYPINSLMYCSDGGTGKAASCSGYDRLDMSAYEYTPLPTPQSTCESAITGENAIPEVSWVWVSSIILVVALIGVLLYKSNNN